MFRHMSPARWLSLSVLCLAAAFVANTIYSRHVAARIDGYASSITHNSAAGVVYLARVTEDIRLISARAMQVRPESRPRDQAEIASWFQDLDETLRAYRLTEDYPGERELYEKAEGRRLPFLSAVHDALATADDRREIHTAAVERLGATTDALATSIRELTELNAREVAREGAAIADVRGNATTIFLGLRIVTLLLAAAGIFFSSAATRQHVALVENSKRLAEERAKELELFAGRVAHDLRAPLTVIEMKSDVGHRTDAVERLKDALDRIGRQGRRMAEIIDALLAFARAGARPEPESCSCVAEIVEEVTAESQSIAAESGIEFIIDPIPRASVGCSPSVLGIILSNLVRNATKYIDGGSAGIRRITVAMHARDRTLRFQVEDTGPGLPRGTETRVFEPFVRVSGGSGTGIGLGLATVKRLVEAHRGQVGVESVPGRGCRFWFELPRAPDAAIPCPRSPAAPEYPLGHTSTPSARPMTAIDRGGRPRP